MPQGKQYNKPPIDEAVVEFLFDPTREWDATVPGRLQAALANAYPGQPRTQMLFSLAPQVLGTAPRIPFAPGVVSRTLLPSADGKRLIGISANLLTVHELEPYGGWDEFSGRVAEALHVYWNVHVPRGVRRIRVRYVNRIVIPVAAVDLDDYFTSAPRLPGGGGPLQNFITRVEQPYDDGSVAVMTFAPTRKGTTSQSCAFVLDLDLLRSFGDPTDVQTTLAALETLRGRERDAFEAMITDRTRQLFL